MESKDLCQTLSKAFDMSKATAKVSPKQLWEDDQESVMKARRSPAHQIGHIGVHLRSPEKSLVPHGGARAQTQQGVAMCPAPS